MHYKRWAANGNPLALQPKPAFPERFWAKVDTRAPEECWLWTGGHDSNGYSSFGDTRGHRFAYELVVGPIPEGMVIDHLCRNPGCVNPAHLEPVTNAENIRRSPILGKKMKERRTHCAQGHPFDEENTKQTAVQRICRTCVRQWGAAAYARRKAARNG